MKVSVLELAFWGKYGVYHASEQQALVEGYSIGSTVHAIVIIWWFKLNTVTGMSLRIVVQFKDTLNG